MAEDVKWSPALGLRDRHDITTWELPKGAFARLGQGKILQNITPSPDGKYFLVPSDTGVWWYDVSSMTPIDLWDTDRGYISTVSLSPNSKWLATGDGDGLVKVWDVQRKVCTSEMERDEEEKPYHSVSRLVFSPDSNLLAVSSRRDYILYIWNTETGERIAKYHENTNYRWWPFLLRPIAFSPDGSLVACTMADESLFTQADRGGTIRTPQHSSNNVSVWNIEKEEQLACLTEHPDFVYSLCFSPCGNLLVSGGRDGTVRVWSVDDWEIQHTYQDFGTKRKQVFYTADGTLYAMEMFDDDFVVWNIESGQKHTQYGETHAVLQGQHVPKGTPYVIDADNPYKFRKWEVGDSKPRYFSHLHTGVPFSLVFTQDCNTLVGGYWSEEAKVRSWDVTHPSSSPTSHNLSGRDYIVSVSSHGKVYATGRDGESANVWEIGKQETLVATFKLPDEKRPHTDHEWQVSTAAYAPDSNLMACGDSEGMLYVWDILQQKLLHSKKINDGWIKRISFSPDEKLLFAARSTGPVSHLLNVDSGEQIETFPVKSEFVVFSPSNKLIAIAGGKEILLWDIADGETVMEIPLPKDSWMPFALAFSPCGQFLASGAWWKRGFGMKKCPVLLWDVKTGEKVADFQDGHPTDVQCLAFSSDGNILASGGYDGTIILWDTKPYMDS